MGYSKLDGDSKHLMVSYNKPDVYSIVMVHKDVSVAYLWCMTWVVSQQDLPGVYEFLSMANQVSVVFVRLIRYLWLLWKTQECLGLSIQHTRCLRSSLMTHHVFVVSVLLTRSPYFCGPSLRTT